MTIKMLQIITFFIYWALRFFVYRKFLIKKVKFKTYFFGIYLFDPYYRYQFLKYDIIISILCIAASIFIFHVINYFY
jgi:hypothetical protein